MKGFHKLLRAENLPPADPFMDELTEQGFFSDGMGSIEIGKLPKDADCSPESIRETLGITKPS
ncbi:MAG: hypothetical protein Q7S53_01770 [bacterium]|nr:hypothetical protein [bacterium]